MLISIVEKAERRNSSSSSQTSAGSTRSSFLCEFCSAEKIKVLERDMKKMMEQINSNKSDLEREVERN